MCQFNQSITIQPSQIIYSLLFNHRKSTIASQKLQINHRKSTIANQLSQVNCRNSTIASKRRSPVNHCKSDIASQPSELKSTIASKPLQVMQTWQVNHCPANQPSQVNHRNPTIASKPSQFNRCNSTIAINIWVPWLELCATNRVHQPSQSNHCNSTITIQPFTSQQFQEKKTECMILGIHPELLSRIIMVMNLQRCKH